jgi:hypothetical protein
MPMRQNELCIMVADAGGRTNFTHNLVIIAVGIFYQAAFVTRFVGTLTSLLSTYR